MMWPWWAATLLCYLIIVILPPYMSPFPGMIPTLHHQAADMIYNMPELVGSAASGIELPQPVLKPAMQDAEKPQAGTMWPPGP